MDGKKYLKKLEGFDTSFYDVKAAVEDIKKAHLRNLTTL